MALTKAQADIAQFIHFRKNGDELNIKFDHLVTHLIDNAGYRFYASKFEEMLVNEINAKILKRPTTDMTMPALCDYIIDLAAYLTNEFRKQQLDPTNPERTVELQQEMRQKMGMSPEAIKAMREARHRQR